MSDVNWTIVFTTIISTLPLLITALTGFIMVLRRIERIHIATNSMKDELVAVTREAGEAIGRARGRKLEQEDEAVRKKKD